MAEFTQITLKDVESLSFNVLVKSGYGEEHARSIADVICACQVVECHSHGLYRLLVCANTIQSGLVDGTAVPEVSEPAPAIVRVDANKGYSLLAFDTGLPLLIEKTRELGIAALVINNCFHFSALWPEVEKLAKEGLAGMAMLPSHSWVAPAGGTKPALGTNPLAFGWPRMNSEPFVFDFATSAVARGEIELHRREGRALPNGVAVDNQGRPTTDAQAALDGAMLTFGGHKGSALSIMIELLAGPLIDDLISIESMSVDNGAGATPFHGELIIAMDPKKFTGGNEAANMDRAEILFDAIVDQGARLPSQRRYEARERSYENGAVEIPTALYDDIMALLD